MRDFLRMRPGSGSQDLHPKHGSQQFADRWKERHEKVLDGPVPFAFTVAACAQRNRVEYFPPGSPPYNPGLPFAIAVRVGDMLYLAGMVGDDDMALVG